MNRVLREIGLAAREAPRMYFAPVIGVVRGLRVQYETLNAKRFRRGVRPHKKQSNEIVERTSTTY